MLEEKEIEKLLEKTKEIPVTSETVRLMKAVLISAYEQVLEKPYTYDKHGHLLLDNI